MNWTAQEVAAAWSALAEPGDSWAGALRSALGNETALDWAIRPYRTLPSEIEGPGGVRGRGFQAGWLAAHKRWQPRVETLNPTADLNQLSALGGRLVTEESPDWPVALNDLEERRPPALWVLGDDLLCRGSESAVSIVGARAATSYGTRLSAEIAFDVYQGGITVISGGAYGIDAAAHRGALEGQEHAKRIGLQTQARIPTIAVVCGGLTNLYPAGNEALFGRLLAEGGLVVAEVPPSYRPARWRFLERNRLIAAWSAVTLVVEAGLRSGALATANRAVDLGREVAALPGPVTSFSSAGPHQLLKDGAALVECGRDLMQLAGVDTQATSAESAELADSVESAVSPATPDLDGLTQRVLEALPLFAEARAESVARVAGVSQQEAQRGLLRLKEARKADVREGLWRRTSEAA